MVATPVLAGAVLRIVTGVLADHLKPRLTAHHHADDRDRRARRLLGLRRRQLSRRRWRLASCSASPARPSPSRCRSPPTGIRREHQGTALGIAGAGNSGTVLAALFAPSLAVALGWRNVLGLAIVPLADRARAVRPARQEQPARRRRASRSRTTPRSSASRDAWWLMAFYCVTFGGFVGLSLVPADLFQRPVRPLAGRRRLLHRGLRVRRFVRPAVRRRGRRPDRRRQGAELRLWPRRGPAADRQPRHRRT